MSPQKLKNKLLVLTMSAVLSTLIPTVVRAEGGSIGGGGNTTHGVSVRR